MKRQFLRMSLALGLTALATQPALAAEEYVFDRGHTNIHFEWSHFGFSTTSAEFEDFTGTLSYNPDDPTKSEVDVTIDVDSLDTGFDTFNDDLRDRAEWFNTQKHPEATFESTGIESTGEDTYKVTGDLTLKGVTREVTLDVTINKIGTNPITKAKTIGFDATTTVSRSAFNMGKYTPAISDEVTIEISSEMQRKSDL